MDKPGQLRGCTVLQVRLAIPRPFINRFRRNYLDVVIQAASLLPSLVPRFVLQVNFRVAYRRIIGCIFDAVTTRQSYRPRDFHPCKFARDVAGNECLQRVCNSYQDSPCRRAPNLTRRLGGDYIRDKNRDVRTRKDKGIEERGCDFVEGNEEKG